MVKVPVPIEEVMSNPNLSATSSPFAPGKLIIKRASFPGGKVPEHLRPFLFDGNEGQAGERGTVILDGKPVPASAAAVAERAR